MAEVLVLVDHLAGDVRKSTLEMLTIARRLGTPSAVFCGSLSDGAKARLSEFGILRIEVVEDFLGPLGRHLLEQVGCVVRIHLLDHVCGALVLEQGHEFDALLLRHLLEDVGKPFVIEFAGDVESTL